MDITITIPVFGVFALFFAGYLIWFIKRQKTGTPRMQEVCGAIREGAMAFLKREYRILAIFIFVMALILGFFIDPYSGVVFVIGAACSMLTGYFGIRIATQANVRTAEAARTSLGKALKIAFYGGSVTGMIAVGLGLTSLYVVYYGLTFTPNDMLKIAEIIASFGLGASSVALFARVGGGIYTKGADVGADLVGKVEKNIPEDDPRNPATIADNVGDNVGDVCGMGADLFESYISAIIATIVIGVITFTGAMILKAVLLPFLIAAVGIAASIIGIFFVRSGEKELVRGLRKGVYVAAGLFAVLSFIVVYSWIGLENLGIFYAILAGLGTGLLIGLNTEYFTLPKYKPTKNLAKSSQTGAGTIVIDGTALGMYSTAIPVIVVGLAIYLAYHFAGFYGIAIAGVGMLATLGITLSSDAYGPIADNASGIVEMSKLGGKVRKRTDTLDELGNTTAATGKGFAIGSAALTTLGWIAAYVLVINEAMASAGLEPLVMSLTDPKIIIGLFIGGMVSFIFSAIALKAVSKTASKMVREVRRQFKEIKGLMQGKAKPDYARCVDISTKTALKEMILPGLLAVVAPLLVGFTLGVEALCALLVGATVTGFLLAVFMANAGGAWDNAKKYIEQGHFGGKGSDAHHASVIGDIVGDPYKDTAGPSLNILIKLMSKVALIFAPLFILLI